MKKLTIITLKIWLLVFKKTAAIATQDTKKGYTSLKQKIMLLYIFQLPFITYNTSERFAMIMDLRIR
jgi:hypothetical protein